MLAAIEQKLTSILGDDLATRTHLDVIEAPAKSAPTAGRGAVVVSLAEWTPTPLFERGQFSSTGTQRRRVQPVQFKVKVEYHLHPGGNSAAQLASARELMLTDVSLISYGLARTDLYNGKGFAPVDPDPGFRVFSFGLQGGGVDRDADASSGLLTAQLHYLGHAEIWPPGAVQDEGEILAIDTTSVALPLRFTVTNPVLRASETTQVTTQALPAARLATLAPDAHTTLQLAVTVLSDAPPAQRGSISGGSTGQESGFRIIDVTQPTTEITYQAPAAAVSRTRTEYVAVHLATPDGHSGVLLGSVAVRLEPG